MATFDMNKVYALLDAYKSGRLGGEKMPEDENPGLDKASKENYLYFTLPMALNYQRNSYTLWECANKTYRDVDTIDVFDTLVQRILSNWQFDLSIFPIALLPKPRRSHRYACVCEVVLSEKYSASNYPKLNIRCTSSSYYG